MESPIEVTEGVDGWNTIIFLYNSALKEVGNVSQDLAQKALDGEFPGGSHEVYGLAEEGVGLTDGQLSEEALSAVEEARAQIIAGEIEVPEVPEED